MGFDGRTSAEKAGIVSIGSAPTRTTGFDGRTTAEKVTAVNAAKAAAPKPDYWADNVVPMLTANPKSKLEENYNYANTPHIIQAVNGGYDNIIQATLKTDPELSKQFSALKLASNNIAKNIRVYNLTGDPTGLNAETKKANDTYEKLYSSLANNNSWRLTDEGKALTKTDYDKQDQEAHEGPNYSNTARVVYNRGELQAAYESSGTSGEYEKLQSINKKWESMALERAQPIVNSWVGSGIRNLDPTDTKKANRNAEAVDLIVDLINHTRSYSLNANDKAFAENFSKKFNTYTAPQQMSMIKNNADRLNQITGNLGFYGTAKLFQRHKQSETNPNATGNFSYNFPKASDNDKDFFTDQLELTEIYNERDKFVQIKKGFSGLVYQNVKVNWKAVSDAAGIKINKKDFDQVFDAFVTKEGTMEGYTAWKNKLKKIPVAGSENRYVSDMDTPIFGSTNLNRQRRRISLLDTLAEKNMEYHGVDDFFTKAVFNGERTQANIDEDLLLTYEALKTQYKKSYANESMKSKYDQTMLKAGFGDSVNKSVVIPGLDLTVDKNYNVLSQTTPKQANVRNLLSLLQDDKGNIKQKDITVLNGEDINVGLHALTKNELKVYAPLNPLKVKGFFKGDMTNVTMEFFRNTNVENTSAYSLYNKTTKKQILIYVPQSDLDKVQEKTYISTKKDIAEFNFEAIGYATMPVHNPDNYESAKLTYDQELDKYVGTVIYEDADGNKKPYSHIIPSGHAVNLKAAKNNFNSFLKEFTPN